MYTMLYALNTGVKHKIKHFHDPKLKFTFKKKKYQEILNSDRNEHDSRSRKLKRAKTSFC